MSSPIDLAAALERLVSVRADLRGIAVGIDAVDVRRLNRQLSGTAGRRFVEKMFTASEIADCRGLPERFAARWAVKEAVAKAIGTGFRDLQPNMVEVVKSETGQPSVRPATTASWPASAERWTWAISMAHDGDAAIAIAIALTGQD
jgi:holo-[acyl-carrier protein] synthase